MHLYYPWNFSCWLKIWHLRTCGIARGGILTITLTPIIIRTQTLWIVSVEYLLVFYSVGMRDVFIGTGVVRRGVTRPPFKRRQTFLLPSLIFFPLPILLSLLSFPILPLSDPSLPSAHFPYLPFPWPPPLPLEVGPLNPARGSGGALWAPAEGSPQPKSNLVHISLKIWQLVATIFNDFAENRLSKFRAFFHPAVFCRDNDACRFEQVTKHY